MYAHRNGDPEADSQHHANVDRDPISQDNMDPCNVFTNLLYADQQTDQNPDQDFHLRIQTRKTMFIFLLRLSIQ